MTDLLEVAPSNVDPQTRASLTRFASDLGEGALRNLLLALSDSLASGCTVALLDVDADYTPAQVAKQLRMSRTHLYKLLDSGDIPVPPRRSGSSHHRTRYRRLRASPPGGAPRSRRALQQPRGHPARRNRRTRRADLTRILCEHRFAVGSCCTMQVCSTTRPPVPL